MKWFHHECSARRDLKLQTIGASFGSEGLGISWGLLEESGQQSGTFHLKVSGVSAEVDENFARECGGNTDTATRKLWSGRDPSRFPQCQLGILAHVLFTSAETLSAVIKACVEAGLFDRLRWEEFHVLYSPGFEQRADNYIRRVIGRSGFPRSECDESPDIRTIDGQSAKSVCTSDVQRANSVGTMSSKVPLEQNRLEQTTGEEEAERNLLVDGRRKEELSTDYPPTGPFRPDSPEIALQINLSEEEFHAWSNGVRGMIRSWNEGRSNRFDRLLRDEELKKLFYSGEKEHKIRLCDQAVNLTGQDATYPAVVSRAVQLMLESSLRKRITNPFGWVWACLRGSGGGTPPWVQLLTGREESGLLGRWQGQEWAST